MHVNTNLFSTNDRKLLFQCAVLALFLETTVLMLFSLPWLPSSSLQTQTLREDQYIEVQSFETLPQARLETSRKLPAHPKSREVVLNRSHAPRPANPSKVFTQEDQNQVQQGAELASDRSPVAIYAPSPIIPSYLQNQDIHATVVVLFYINSLGEVVPRLTRSSGNTELDFVALDTVKKWKFKPAIRDRQPIDAKVSLKIIFEVH